MATFWDERYASNEYVYGTSPNEFFKKELDQLKPGKILLPAEGEGRNAVYAAARGWDVFAFDLSIEGQKKALKLAETKSVSLHYEVAGFEDVALKSESYDAIALTFAHVPPTLRSRYHQKLIDALKPHGTIILVGFSKSQINNTTGGPRNIEMLFSREELESDFKALSLLQTEYKTVHLSEGEFHSGESDIITMLGKK